MTAPDRKRPTAKKGASDEAGEDQEVFVCDGCGQWDDHAEGCMVTTGRWIKRRTRQ